MNKPLINTADVPLKDNGNEFVAKLDFKCIGRAAPIDPSDYWK